MTSTWYVYIIECADDTWYTGVSTDVARRFKEHASGGAKAAKYLRGRGPLNLVHREPAASRSEAQSLEQRIKSLSKAEKKRVVTSGGNFSELFSSHH